MKNEIILFETEDKSKKVAEKLGIPCYDAELIQKIAEESGYTADYI